MQAILVTGVGLGFIFMMTCIGAATVFFFRKPVSGGFRQIFFGFAAGVMISASVWSLLIPAVEEAEAKSAIGWIPAVCGFAVGALMLVGLDRVIPHVHPRNTSHIHSHNGEHLHSHNDSHMHTQEAAYEGPALASKGPASISKRATLLIFAVIMHNIPVGMAVGLSLALAVQHNDQAMFTSSIALALGISIHNLPEGAAISLPLRQEGMSTDRAFGLACLSGAVAPVCGLIGVLLAFWIAPFMPWLLSIAAGAMIYVVVEELLPEAHLGEHSYKGALSFIGGFLLMMALELALE